MGFAKESQNKQVEVMPRVSRGTQVATLTKLKRLS